ncbi:phosphonoacetate hydrolase [Aeromonas enteropelogenes]|uniref:phosphonoacetate hydrolase n=1 Tax=Aeromonas enteropelogenes TaxID=29489 RepID=UPI003BA0EBB1
MQHHHHEQYIEVCGRTYLFPKQPTVVICIDGCAPGYITESESKGVIPAISSMISSGFYHIADAVIPAFTNPNNVSIICGAPPSVHGVTGNYYLDKATGQEIMMLDASQMRSSTILSEFANAGASVAVVTAKDKLRKALSYGLNGIAFSAQNADECTLGEHGIEDVTTLVGREAPDQYSADLSLFVLDAGIKLLETRQPDLLYLSLSDLVQHQYDPEHEMAQAFMHEIDQRIQKIQALGAVIGIVADHGMSDLSREDGTPNVVYLGDILDQHHGHDRIRVICPITDPFVKHHGALGGFVRVHLLDESLDRETIMQEIAQLPGIERAMSGEMAAACFELPLDREADIVVLAAKGVALGARAVDHDLSQLEGRRLRSHGSLSEQQVPFLVSHAISETYRHKAKLGLRNFDIFDYVLNGLE